MGRDVKKGGVLKMGEWEILEWEKTDMQKNHI